MEPNLERHDANAPHRGEYDGAPGLLNVPAGLLQRHGARVLDPATAAAIAGEPPPRSTVYRSRSLLVPDDLVGSRGVRDALGAAGLELVKTGPPGQEPECADPDAVRRLSALPRPAVLRPLARPGQPVVVDAWVALQALRAAAAHGDHQDLRQEDVDRIGLDHLLFGSAITGSPASDGGGLAAGNPASDGGGLSGPPPAGSYMLGGYDARLPVQLSMRAPARTTTGRRPVVAILDTGVRAHPWLDVTGSAATGYATVAGGFAQKADGIQAVVDQQDAAVRANGDRPRQVIDGPWDKPVTANPLVGELDTCTGHCTFSAGIVRQLAPQAQVLSVRIMHSDGVVYEDVLLCALSQIAIRVAHALATGDMTGMVDVLCLSLGYFSETAADQVYTAGLKTVIDVLLSLGVIVTAAAGNYATTRRFYPAGLAGQPAAGELPLVSVGALNPNGSQALFSDGGSWVTDWAPGAAIVSTFPTDVRGSREPPVSTSRRADHHQVRQALDPDDYSGGFAVWSGTSFAAPWMAAVIARELAAELGNGAGRPAGGAQPTELVRRRALAAIGRARAGMAGPA